MIFRHYRKPASQRSAINPSVMTFVPSDHVKTIKSTTRVSLAREAVLINEILRYEFLFDLCLF